MTDIKKNRLWGLTPTSENLNNAQGYPHSYACADHCLVISPEEPDGAMEIREELYKYLTNDDWDWIFRESDKIRLEQEETYSAEIRAAQKEFLAKFEEQLRARKAELSGGGDIENN